MKKLIAVILVILAAESIFAQQSNFSVSPPPIPWYEFSKSDWDTKFGLTYMKMTGDLKGEDVSGELDVNSAGANILTRYGVTDILALDTGLLYAYASGDIGSSADMTMSMIVVPADIEFQPLKSETFNILLFAGWNFSWNSLEINADGPPKTTLSVNSSMKGPQFGVECSLLFSTFLVSPYFTVAKLEGNSSVDITQDGSASISENLSVASTYAYNFGFDIVYLPYRITLSSIFQLVSDSDESDAYNTYIFSVSYSFRK